MLGVLLINLLLLQQYLSGLLTVTIAASTVCFHSMLPQYAFTVITAASTCDTMNGDPLPVALFQEDTRANPSPHSDPTLGLYANWKI
jgi:hypothetical protein